MPPLTLALATLPDGSPARLPGAAPFEGSDLLALHGVAFGLPCDDPWLRSGGSRAHTYLESARQAWRDHPEWMDFLDMESPAWDLKRASRDLYLHALGPLRSATRVLDVGCGIGRMTQPFLDEGATVIGCDGDLDSLRRCAWHAAGRPGRLDLRWTTPAALPDVSVELALAVEVLCYVDDPLAALREIRERVAPGGSLLLAMEARWGWAAANDAPADGVDVALGAPGPLYLPGDRFVHLLEADDVRALLDDAGFEPMSVTPTHYLPEGPLEDLLPADLTLERLLELEAGARAHPVWSPLNRVWTAIGRRR